MHVYRYSFWRLLASALFGFAMAYGGYWMTQEFDGRGEGLGYAVMAIGPFLALFTLRFLLSNREVLRIDARGIEYKTLFGTERVLWRDFRGAAVETVNTRTSSARHLKLDFGKGYFGNCSISETLLEAGTGGVEGMLATLRECMQGANALDRGDYRHPSLGQAETRQPQPAAAAPSVVSGFGRKGL